MDSCRHICAPDARIGGMLRARPDFLAGGLWFEKERFLCHQ